MSLQVMDAILQTCAAAVEVESGSSFDRELEVVNVFVLFDESANRRRQCDLVGLIPRVVISGLIDHWITHDDELPDRTDSLWSRHLHVPHARHRVCVDCKIHLQFR